MPGFEDRFTDDFMAYAADADSETKPVLKETLHLIWKAFREEYEWIEEENSWRMRSRDLKNGIIVETASVHTQEEYDRFTERMRTQRVQAEEFERTLTVSYATLAGDGLTFTYGGPRLLNGRSVDLGATPLYDGPFISADVGTGKITLRYGDRLRVLDFPGAAITEE